jgi:hypothetical protein
VRLVWSGNQYHLYGPDRSMPLASLIEHLPDGFEYISLQRIVRDERDRETLLAKPQIVNFGDELVVAVMAAAGPTASFSHPIPKATIEKPNQGVDPWVLCIPAWICANHPL